MSGNVYASRGNNRLNTPELFMPHLVHMSFMSLLLYNFKSFLCDNLSKKECFDLRNRV